MKINLIYQAPSSKTIEFSCKEMAFYLGRLLPDSLISINNLSIKADLTIFFAIAPTDKNRSAENASETDCYSVQIGEAAGSITGNNDRSVLLGVYDYLQTLGCRFLGPGKQCEVIPAIGHHLPVVGYEKKASFLHRGICIEGADSLENILDFIDWLPKAGYNSFFLQFKVPYTFLARWYQHEKNPFLKAEAFTMEDAIDCMETIEAAIKERDLILHKYGHGWTGEALGFPTVEWKENTAPLTPKQQKLIASIDGKRHLFHNIPANTNLCYSNPEATETLGNLIAEYADRNSDVDYLHIWLADEYNNVCECGECQKTTLSDQYVNVLNLIDQKLTEKKLKTRIVFLLYQELLWPPVREQLNNPDRFVLMFAPISRTFEASYDLSLPDGEIPEYRRNKISLPVSLTENLTFLKAWQKLFHGDSFIYDYPLGRAHYGDLGYLHISRIISGDIKKLKQLGLNGYISCQELRVCFPNALPNYIMGKTLFNETADIQELIEEYFRAAYGDDCQSVINYLEEISSLCSCDYFNGKGQREDKVFAARMSRIKQVISSFTPILKKHCSTHGHWENLFWKLLDYHRQYALRLGEALFYLSGNETEKLKESCSRFKQLICEYEPEFQQFLDVYRVLEVAGKYTGLIFPSGNPDAN